MSEMRKVLQYFSGPRRLFFCVCNLFGQFHSAYPDIFPGFGFFLLVLCSRRRSVFAFFSFLRFSGPAAEAAGTTKTRPPARKTNCEVIRNAEASALSLLSGGVSLPDGPKEHGTANRNMPALREKFSDRKNTNCIFFRRGLSPADRMRFSSSSNRDHESAVSYGAYSRRNCGVLFFNALRRKIQTV